MLSLIHLMHVIAHAQASTRATSLMHVKNSWCHLFMTLIVWDIGMMKMKEQKHQIE